MEKTKFIRMASNLIATDVPALIELQQNKLLGSFSYDFVQFKDTLFIRFFAHGYNKNDIVYTARIMDNKKGVDYNEVKKYREFIQNLQK